jgi:hypothetical protein
LWPPRYKTRHRNFDDYGIIFDDEAYLRTVILGE